MLQIVMVIIITVVSACFCQAGWLDSTLEGVGKKVGNKVVNEAVKGDGRAPDRQPVVRSPLHTGTENPDERSSSTVPSNLSLEEAEKVLTKFDFVPGDKTIFFDDFTDTDVGEFPRKWTLDGPKAGTSNTIDVVEYQGHRFLRSVPGAKGQAPATQYIRLDQKGDFPEKFTVEFDAVFDTVSKGSNYYTVYRLLFVSSDKKINVFRWHAPNSLQLSGKENSSANTKTIVDLNDGKTHHVAISVNGTFVKAYIDNQRVINDPDGLKRPIKQIGLQMLTHNNMRSEQMRFTNFRLAQGGKDIKSALATDGKIITHGIQFDTGKASLKAESLPTLKMVLGLLQSDQSLKFSIEGHTDNQGGKGINQPLSEQRAEAVKRWLEGKGVDSVRLKSAGLGDARPIDTNQSPEGRANNRRVEFVKF